MSDDPESDDPWTQPPEWVPLSDLPQWLARHFELPGDGRELVRDIIQAIQCSDLRYEVHQLDAEVGSHLPPAGFGREEGYPSRKRCIFVTDWEAAAPDWHAGTVAGPARAGGGDNRYALRVWWRRAVTWAEPFISRIRRRRVQQSTLPPPQPREGMPTPGPQVRQGGVATKRKVHGSDFRAADASLVAEMHTIIDAKEAKNPTDAARKFAKRAEGGGTEESKVKRLLLRYAVQYPDRK